MTRIPRWKAELAIINAICALYWCNTRYSTKRMDEAWAKATSV